MKDEINNEKTQIIIFLLSIAVLIISLISIIHSGIGSLFEFGTHNYNSMRSRRMPEIVLVLTSLIIMYFSAKNLIRINKRRRKQ